MVKLPIYLDSGQDFLEAPKPDAEMTNADWEVLSAEEDAVLERNQSRSFHKQMQQAGVTMALFSRAAAHGYEFQNLKTYQGEGKWLMQAEADMGGDTPEITLSSPVSEAHFVAFARLLAEGEFPDTGLPPESRTRRPIYMRFYSPSCQFRATFFASEEEKAFFAAHNLDALFDFFYTASPGAV